MTGVIDFRDKRMSMSVVSWSRRSKWWLPVVALAALAVCGINEVAYRQSVHAITNLSEHAEATFRIQRVLRLLIDAETGQRGYLLTGRQDYLTPYLNAATDARAHLNWLSNYYKSDPVVAKLVQEVSKVSETKLSELSTSILMFEQGRHSAWRELLLTDMGRESMDSIRTLSGKLMQIELDRAALDRQTVNEHLLIGRLGVPLAILFSLLGLALFLRQGSVLQEAERRHADEIKHERDQLEHEVARRTEDLTQLARHLQTAIEHERTRLSRELHDELGALLTAAKLDAARLRRVLGTISPEAEDRLKHLNDSINNGIGLKRRIIEDLRPSSLSHLGLVPALEIQAQEFARRTDVDVQYAFDPVLLSESAQITVYRLIQEALTNMAKHAEATEVILSLRAEKGRALISVTDNGKGFDPNERRGSAHGLMGMRYRVESEGGSLTVHSRPGAGTRIEAWIPLLEA